MPRLRSAEQALRFASASRQQYVCRTCRAQFHTSRAVSAGQNWMERMKSFISPSKESKEADRQREEMQKKKAEEQALAKQDDLYSGPETKTYKGVEYEVAELVDPATSRDYVKATTWDGMERIGGPKWVKQQADRGEQYVGFMPKKRLQLTDEQWAKLLHHVAVEIMTLQKASRDLNDVCRARSEGSDNWLRTRNVKLEMTHVFGNRVPKFVFEPASLEEEILQSIPIQRAIKVEQKAEAEEMQMDQELKPVQTTEDAILQEVSGATIGGELEQYADGQSWMETRIDSPKVKLVFLKRLMQLTGHRISDPTISNAKTLADLYNTLKAKEPAKKLAKTEEMQRLNLELPNVVVHPSRRTPIHKEKQIGRWKVIEDELRARDLPITGSRYRDAKTKAPQHRRHV